MAARNGAHSGDRDRISLTQDHEIRDWSKRQGVSEDRLRAAVGKVGNLAYDVRAYLLSGRKDED